jgi:hypothetical protein
MFERAHLATIHALLEEDETCERCPASADVALEIGVYGEGNREILACLPCAFELIVMLKRAGRLERT